MSLKRILSSFLIPKRGLFLLVFCVALFGILLIPQGAQAACISPECLLTMVVDGLVNVAILISQGLPILGFTLLLYVLAILASLIASALNVVLAYLIGIALTIRVVPYTDGVPTVVNVGWSFTQDLVNTSLIVILAFIGLATILGLQEYAAKKNLVRLLIIAFLVNFSGVFVGFVVDIANIFTSFFLSKIASFNIAFGAITGIAQNLINTVAGIVAGGGIFDDPLSFTIELLSPAAQALVVTVFFAIFSLVLFIMLLLFLMRVGILWLLVILSPLAFAMFILPKTKGYWNFWLQQLFQWSIITIPMSFFLYLSTYMIQHMGEIDIAFGIGNPDYDLDLAAILPQFFGPMLALLTLGVGIAVSMKTSAWGASQALKEGTKWGTGKGIKTGSVLWRKYGRHAEGLGSGMVKKGLALQDNKGGVLGPAKLRLGKNLAQSGSLLAMGARHLTAQVGTKDTEEIKKAKAKAAKLETPQDVIDGMKVHLGPLKFNMNGAIGFMTSLLEQGRYADLNKAMQDGTFDMNDVRKVYKGARERRDPEYARTIEKAFSGRIDELIPDEKKAAEKLEENARHHIQAKDFEKTITSSNFDPATEGGKKAFWAYVQGDPELFGAMIKNARDPEVIKRIRAEMETESKGLDWFVENNLTAPLIWSTSTAAAAGDLSFAPLFGLDKEDINHIIEEKIPASDKELAQQQADLIIKVNEAEKKGVKKEKRERYKARLELIEEEVEFRKQSSEKLQSDLEDSEDTLDELKNEQNRDAASYAQQKLEEGEQRKIKREFKRRRESQEPEKEQFVRKLQGVKTKSETELAQLEQREQELNTFIKQAISMSAPGASAPPSLTADLAMVSQQKQGVQDRLRTIEKAAQQIESAPSKGILDTPYLQLGEELRSLHAQKQDIEQELKTAPSAVKTFLRGIVLPENLEGEALAKLGKWKKQFVDLRSLQGKIKSLQSRLEELPLVRDVENDLTQNQNHINKMQQIVSELEREVSVLQAVNPNNVDIKTKTDEKRTAEAGLLALQQKRKDLQTDLSTAWDAERATNLKFRYAEQLANILAHEKDSSQKLTQQRRAQAPQDQIAKTEGILDQIQRDREDINRTLVATIQLEDLEKQKRELDDLLRQGKKVGAEYTQMNKEITDRMHKIKTMEGDGFLGTLGLVGTDPNVQEVKDYIEEMTKKAVEKSMKERVQGFLDKFPEKEIRKAMKEEKDKQEKQKKGP